MQPIIDERANEAQRDALFYILSGADQKAGTMFQIFSVIVETIKDPQFTPITFEWDLVKRSARVEVPGIVRASSEPIRNPVTNEEHRILTVLPDGWVFHEARAPPVPQGHRGDKVRSQPPAQLARQRRLGSERAGSFLRRVQTDIRPAVATAAARK